MPIRVILCERDLEEVLDSQDHMLRRRKHPAATRERREILKQEYAGILDRVKKMLENRPESRLLMVNYHAVVSDPRNIAREINAFLDGAPDTAKMASAVDPALHRNRARG